MKSKTKVIVLSATILMALYVAGAESCCSHDGKVTATGKNEGGEAIISVKQIDESIATLQRMKARIPPGQGGISVREIMVMQMEELKKSPEYAKMPKDEKTRLDAAIETARRPPAATTRKDGVRKPTAMVPTQDMVEISDGTRAFFMPKQRARPVSARKRRK